MPALATGYHSVRRCISHLEKLCPDILARSQYQPPDTPENKGKMSLVPNDLQGPSGYFKWHWEKQRWTVSQWALRNCTFVIEANACYCLILVGLWQFFMKLWACRENQTYTQGYNSAWSLGGWGQPLRNMDELSTAQWESSHPCFRWLRSVKYTWR